MLILNNVGVLYNKPDIVTELGRGETVHECYEILREHLLQSNKRIIEMSKTMEVPDIIVKNSQKNIRKNPFMQFELHDCDGEKGVVFINGQCPEMDYYTITKEDESRGN